MSSTISSNDEPVQNTCATSAHATQQAHILQNIPSYKETHLSELSKVPTCPSSTISCEESILTLIAN
jgi:hypothetical protein